MTNIWFWSDQHFCHANILTFTNETTGRLIRPGFIDVEDMNECLIENHNNRVADGDKVYYLGDLCFGGKENLHRIMPRLKGRKRLVLGNHDCQSYGVSEYLPYFTDKGEEKIFMWRQFKNMPYPFIATHVPMHVDGLYGRGCVWNVHGHIHERTVKRLTPGMKPIEGSTKMLLGAWPEDDVRYINVSVEQINYRPIHMDELQQRMKDSGL